MKTSQSQSQLGLTIFLCVLPREVDFMKDFASAEGLPFFCRTSNYVEEIDILFSEKSKELERVLLVAEDYLKKKKTIIVQSMLLFSDKAWRDGFVALAKKSSADIIVVTAPVHKDFFVGCGQVVVFDRLKKQCWLS